MRVLPSITTHQDEQTSRGESSLPQDSISRSSGSSKDTFKGSLLTSSPMEDSKCSSNWFVPLQKASGKCSHRGVTTNVEKLECRQTSSKISEKVKVTMIVLGVIAALCLAFSLGYSMRGIQCVKEIRQCTEENLQQIHQCGEKNLQLIRQCGEENLQLIRQCREEKERLIAKCSADRKEAFEADAKIEQSIRRAFG